MLSEHLGAPNLQKLVDYEADGRLEETEEEKRRPTTIKDMRKPPTDWWEDMLVATYGSPARMPPTRSCRTWAATPWTVVAV